MYASVMALNKSLIPSAAELRGVVEVDIDLARINVETGEHETSGITVNNYEDMIDFLDDTCVYGSWTLVRVCPWS